MLLKKFGTFFYVAKNFPKKSYKNFINANLGGIFSELPILTFLLLVVRFDIKLLKILLNSFKSLKKFLLFIIDIFLLFPKSLKCLNFYKR